MTALSTGHFARLVGRMKTAPTRFDTAKCNGRCRVPLHSLTGP